MSEKPETGPFIRAFALRIEKATSHIEMIGITPKGGEPRKRDYEDEARWYVGYHIAQEMHSDHTVKDWAHYVIEGMQPLTDEDVKEFFWPEDGEEITGMPSHKELVRWFHG